MAEAARGGIVLYDHAKMQFEDHYSVLAESYARARPRYPDALFTWLASLLDRRELAWDVGTGSGQVASALTTIVDRVMASDASADQLSRASRVAGVEYRHETAHHVSLPDRAVDLITAGAAAHWFELDRFYREVQRVGREGAVIALFSYGPRDFADACTRLLGAPLVHQLNEELLGPLWPEKIERVHDRYASLPFPFEELAAPEFFMTATWNVEELIAFLETWSAAQRYLERFGRRATGEIANELTNAWGDPSLRREIRFPLFVRAGRVA
ncbi:MAG TPA: class I SAM-dependent methyltransferase [Thermoanaerobaculia bacterium]|nr:class I SAM-dependent methyltransferase [Thermoanaerobaculia bacterium]